MTAMTLAGADERAADLLARDNLELRWLGADDVCGGTAIGRGSAVLRLATGRRRAPAPVRGR